MAFEEVDDLAQLQHAVVAAVRELVRADGATFVLREGDRCFYADEDSIAPLWKGQRFPLTACISGWAMLHHEPAVVPDVEADERIPIEAYRPTFVRSLAMVPVGQDEPAAAIGVYWGAHRTLDDGQLAKLEAVADDAAIALHRIGLGDAPWAPTFR